MQNNSSNTQLIRRSVAVALLAIFAFYYASTTLFTHCHVVDGVTIAHSHIHSALHGNNSSTDDHTKSQLTLIKLISIYLAEEQTPQPHLTIAVKLICPIHIDICEEFKAANPFALPILRAPPVAA